MGRRRLFHWMVWSVLAALVVAGCSMEVSEEWTADGRGGPASSSRGGSRRADTLVLPKIRLGGVDPILAQARKNSRFDADKWLKSDYAFFRRTHPGALSPYDKTIKKMALRYGFDWRFIAAQIFTESNFRNRAKSHVGATGLMQIMPSTAKHLGFNPATLHLPEINIAVGCMYNQRMYSLWGRQTKNKHQRKAFALASYNAGRGRVLGAYRKVDPKSWKTVHPKLPAETQDYVHKIYLKHDFYKDHLLP